MLHLQASELLHKLVAELHEVPSRRYVSDGAPVLDCEQLTVHLETLNRGTTRTNRALSIAAPTVATFVIIRVWPTQKASRQGVPSTEQMAAFGRTVVEGGWDLWLAALKTTTQMDCDASVDSAQAIDASGGYAAWRVNVRMHVTA